MRTEIAPLTTTNYRFVCQLVYPCSFSGSRLLRSTETTSPSFTSTLEWCWRTLRKENAALLGANTAVATW